MQLTIEDTFYETLEIYDTETVLGMADFDVGLRQKLEASESTTTTATDAITLMDTDTVIQLIDPGGSDRIVTLPAESTDNHGYLIFNTADADGEELTVKNDGGSTLATVYRNGAGWFVSNGTNWKSAGLGTMNPDTYYYRHVCEGRLSLTTGVPVTTADVVDATTLYFTPYNGNKVAIYDTAESAWEVHEFTERSIVVSGFTASKNFDIFINDESGTLTLTGLVWTDDTTRATALAWHEGRLVKSGATDYLYLGSIRIDADQKCNMIFKGGQANSTPAKLNVWNYYNRIQQMFAIETSANWTYGTAAWRQANADTDNQADFVIGVSEDRVYARYHNRIDCGVDEAGLLSVGLDAVNATATDADVARFYNNAGSSQLTCEANYLGYPGIGYHYLAPIENVAAGTVTYEDGGYFRCHGVISG